MELELLSTRSKVTDLEAELSSQTEDYLKKINKLQRAREEEKQAAHAKIALLETQNEECLEKEIDHEKQITRMEDDYLKAKVCKF